jgi:nucleoid-associated protein YgaU
MIFNGSRYSDGELYYDEDNDIMYLAPHYTSLKVDESKDYIYRVKQYDRLDLIAEKFYGNPQSKWIILYANPQYITEFDIKVGDELVIPNLDERM